MNHDVSHCSDYNPDTCPKSCFRAQVTADLYAREDLAGLPFSFMAFHTSGDPECPLAPTYVREKQCEYCHEGLDGYTKPLEKNCHAYVDGSKHNLVVSFGKQVSHCAINFCPMCGRGLRE